MTIVKALVLSLLLLTPLFLIHITRPRHDTGLQFRNLLEQQDDGIYDYDMDEEHGKNLDNKRLIHFIFIFYWLIDCFLFIYLFFWLMATIKGCADEWKMNE